MQHEPCPFTRREKLAVQMIADGKAIKVISFEMAVNYRTIQRYLDCAKEKAGATALPNLAAISLRNGWVL